MLSQITARTNLELSLRPTVDAFHKMVAQLEKECVTASASLKESQTTKTTANLDHQITRTAIRPAYPASLDAPQTANPANLVAPQTANLANKAAAAAQAEVDKRPMPICASTITADKLVMLQHALTNTAVTTTGAAAYSVSDTGKRAGTIGFEEVLGRS